MTVETFPVQEIHCDSCERAIRKSLLRVEGVSDVEPDHRTNEVRVTFDHARVAGDQIAAQLAEAGYPVVA
jgi:copper chaperone CopZ